MAENESKDVNEENINKGNQDEADKSEADKSEADKSEADKSEADKSEADKSEIDKSQIDKENIFEESFDDLFKEDDDPYKNSTSNMDEELDDLDSIDFTEESTNNEEKVVKKKRINVNFRAIRTKAIKKAKKIIKEDWIELTAVLFLAVILSGIVIYKDSLKNKIEEEIVFVNIKENIGSIPNYIYIENDFSRRGDIQLIKILFDTEKTKIYFNSKLDAKKYFVVLTDEDGNQYKTLEPPYVYNQLSVIVLEPIIDTIKNFKIAVVSRHDDSNKFFLIRVNKEIKKPRAKYLDQGVQIKIHDKDLKIKVEGAYFAQSESSFTLSLQNENKKVNYEFGLDYVDDKYANSSISLLENNREIEEFDTISNIYRSETFKKNIIRKIYEPIKSYSNDLEIVLDGIFKKYTVKKYLKTRPLLLRKPTEQHTITSENYVTKFEGLRQYGDLNVLTAYSIDNDYFKQFEDENKDKDEEIRNIYDPIEEKKPIEVEINEEDARVPVFIKAYLEIYKDGKTTRVLGKPKVSKQGTDIIFEHDVLKGTSSKDLDLYIEEISFKIETESIKFNMNNLNDEANEKTLRHLNYLQEYLNSKKISKLTKTEINMLEGSVEELEYNNKLWNIEAYVREDNIMVFIVMELWNGETEKETILFKELHEITLKEQDGFVRLIRDRTDVREDVPRISITLK